MARLLLSRVNLPDGNRDRDVLIEAGRIARIAPAGMAADGAEVFEGDGRLIGPGFVEPHLHLDKALLMNRLPWPIRSVREAIAATAALKRQFSRQDILERAERTLRMALRHGTLAARVHAEVDPVLELKSVEAALELRERWRQHIQLQVVAFPQDGIQRLPGTEDLLREALRMGAEVIGGVPYVDPDHHAHVETVLELAEAHGVPADFHVDFSDDPSTLNVAYIARRTIERGLFGRVAVGHATALAALEPRVLEPLLALIAEAGISVLVLPATDLHLGGRGDAYNTRRGLAPVQRLRAAGVNVAASSNNVRNAFTPFGNADPLEIGLLLMAGAHLSDPELAPVVFEMLTEAGARAMGLDTYGLAEGQPANLVLFEAESVWETVVGQVEKRLVIANGRVVAENRLVQHLELPAAGS